MGEKSGIQWTDATFNPWWGCTKIPQVDGRPSACDFCYAERDSKRYGHDVWGYGADRRHLSEHNWNNPVRWNRKAMKDGKRMRVFCASMADVFEERQDLHPARGRLWSLIEATPMLDWLLLTKRPWLMTKYAPESWKNGWPANVWAGTTTEDQHWFNKRMEALSKVPSRLRFISAEPLFSPINISAYAGRISWIITGSESGPKARLSEWDWIRSLKDQAIQFKTPFFLKQFTMPDKTVIHTPELDGRTWLEVPKSPAA